MTINFVYLIIGATLMMLGIFRFTFYRKRFTKPIKIAGISLTPDTISLLLFIIGFTCILLFFVNEIQPQFYKGRDLRYEPGNY